MCWGMGSLRPRLRKPKPKWCMYTCTGTNNENRKKIQKVEELLQKNTCIVPDYFLNQVVKVGRRCWVCFMWFQLHVGEVTCKFWAIAWSSGCVDAYPGRTSCRTLSMSETPKSGTGPNRLWIRSWPSWKDSTVVVNFSLWQHYIYVCPSRSLENISEFMTKCFSPQEKPGMGLKQI